MTTKEEIFDCISHYSAEQIVGFIKAGIVTIAELEDSSNTGGEYSNDVRTKVRAMFDNAEPRDWEETLSANTVEAFQKYLDSYPNGSYRDEAREHLRELRARHSEKPAYRDNWYDVDPNDISSIQSFLDNNPDSLHRKEALKLINKLKNSLAFEPLIGLDMSALIRRIQNIQADKNVLDPANEIFKLIDQCIEKDSITTQELCDAINNDKNLLNASVIHKLYNEGYLSHEQFFEMGIDREFIAHMLEDVKPHSFPMPDPIDKINKASTEIYFWGIPSSGKSCALGAILSVANSGKVATYMDKDPDCQGYGYMTRLILLFESDGRVSTLPEGTSIYSTYEMGFDLTDSNGRIHPITCIDLAGELVRCMFKQDSGEGLSVDELASLTTLQNILVDKRTNNRKMHFFVIEYGAEDRLYEGMPQKTYLDAALQYIKRTNIFKDDTDAIFVMISKADKIPKGQNKQQVIRDYLNENYLGFINGLKQLCSRYDINDGNVEIIPFSLGTVCFQNYCRFNSESSVNVVDVILKRTANYNRSKISEFIKKIKK